MGTLGPVFKRDISQSIPQGYDVNKGSSKILKYFFCKNTNCASGQSVVNIYMHFRVKVYQKKKAPFKLQFSNLFWKSISLVNTGT